MTSQPSLDETPDFELSQALQESIAQFNKAFINMMLTAARTKDPLGPLLLGLPPETLAAYESTPSFTLLAAHRFGAPLAIARFTEPVQIREVFKTGFSQAQVISQITKGLDVQPVYKQVNPSL